MIIWSLFDGSGLMVQPWAEAGYTCYCFNYDGADHGVYEMRVEHENIVYVNKFITPDSCFSGFPGPDIIFAFPSCTDLAGCGEKHQRQQSSVNTAVATARVAERLGQVYGVPWMVENPVGKMSTLWRKPDYYFHPFEYGGYMSGEENTFHPRMPARDAYTKKTCLWTGNGFVMPEKKPVPHIGKFWGWAYLGGKSEKTKQLRSLTPRGFARAVFEANKG